MVYLGIENLRAEINTAREMLPRTDALGRGVIANFLSSHPYLFWLSIGGPLIYKNIDVHVYATISFILGFCTLLIGSKIGIAFAIEKSKFLIKSDEKYYLYSVRVLDSILILFAAIFVRDGLRLIGLF